MGNGEDSVDFNFSVAEKIVPSGEIGNGVMGRERTGY